MTRPQLTPKQQAFHDYLTSTIAEHRRWPTYREIVDHFAYRSPNSVTQNLQALVKKGYLQRDGHGYRFTSTTGGAAVEGIRVRGSVTEGELRPMADAMLSLKTLFPELDRVYALCLERELLEGAPLELGDHVLVEEGEVPDGGVGVVVQEGRLALRRVFREEDGVRLQPVGMGMGPRHALPDPSARVLGTCVGFVTRRGIFRHVPLERVPHGLPGTSQAA